MFPAGNETETPLLLVPQLVTAFRLTTMGEAVVVMVGVAVVVIVVEVRGVAVVTFAVVVEGARLVVGNMVVVVCRVVVGVVMGTHTTVLVDVYPVHPVPGCTICPAGQRVQSPQQSQY